jgi:molecular chaperone DnaJ
MNKKDYYEVLGIKKDATDIEIKSAFKTLAKKYHPDVSKEVNAEAKFKEAQEAYAILSDKEKRSQYDRMGHQAFNNNGGPGASGFDFNNFDFGDIFGDIFGSSFGFDFGRGSSHSSRRKGRDLSLSLELSFEEAVFGCEKEITLDTNVKCDKCDGEGGFNKTTCSYCRGTGTVAAEQRTILGTFMTKTTCPHCKGVGYTFEDICPDCSGKGIIRKKKNIKVNIPAGIDTGNQLRVAGKGEAGINGGPSGDLYIQFLVRSHQFFKREEDDIYIELPITVTEAILGCKKEIPTIYGNVILTIPSGAQSGEKHRIKGKGIENVQTKRKGDMYVILNVVIPKRLDRNQKNLINELSDTNLEDENFNKYNSYMKKSR